MLKQQMTEGHNPLATPAQLAIERKLIALLSRPEIAAARARVRTSMLTDPVAMSADGARLLDRALDGWLGKLAFDSFMRAAAKAEILWHNQTVAYEWFGQRVPIQAAAIDNVDFVYRCMSFDGDADYVVRGYAPQPAAGLSFQITDDPGGRQGFAMRREGAYDIASAATLLEQDIQLEPDGSFVVTLGPSAAAGRRNHLQTPPRRVQIIARNILDRWTDNLHRLDVTRLDGRKESAAADEEAVVGTVIEDLADHVQFWLDYKEQIAGNPRHNVLVGPHLRTGGWGSAAFVRTRLADDEALVVTLTAAAAAYRGVQFADVWAISPDPLQHTCSFNRAQSFDNADGSQTYVLTRHDHGLVNWIDPAGSAAGFLGFRWIGLPADSGVLVRDCSVVPCSQLAERFGSDGRIDTAGRREQIARRVAEWKQRTRGWRLAAQEDT